MTRCGIGILMKKLTRNNKKCVGYIALVFFWIGMLVPAQVRGITIQEEEELSREFMKVVFQQYEVLKDPVIDDYVNEIGNKILSKLPPQPFKYHFYVVKEDVYNAFATPAGHIFVNSGLFAAMENEEELAGILSHEISHVSARHISQKIERSKKAQVATLAGIVAGALLGVGGAGTAANAVTMGSMAAGQSIMLAYSREDEIQADQMGLEILKKAGYSGSGLLTMLEKIRAKDWFGSNIPTYLKTHPASEDRITYIDSWLVRNHNVKSAGDEYKFKRAQAFLVANYGDKETALRLFEQDVQKQPEDAMAHYGYGLVLARSGNREAAAVHIKSALEKNAFDPYILKDLGKIYFFDGHYEKALNIFENSLGIGQNDPESLLFKGRSQLELGRLEAATVSLEDLVRKDPKYTQAYYFLGEVYGKQGRMSEAHYYLGIYYHRKGQVRNAIFHLNRALNGINDSEKRRNIEDRLKVLRKIPQDQQ